MRRAVGNTIKALNAFPIFGGFKIASYCIHLAYSPAITALGTIRGGLSFQYLKLGENGKKRPQGTKIPAPESAGNELGPQDRQEYQKYPSPHAEKS